MGCDIHAYVDYDTSEKHTASFAKIHIERNYWLFSLLAGVRIEPERLGTTLLVEPRGMPDRLSYVTESDNHLFVVEDKEDDDAGEGCVERSRAEKWVESGLSKWTDEKKNFVTNPDWHTHSYLHVEEVKKVQEQYSNLEDAFDSKNIRKGEPIPEGYRVAETHGNVVIIVPNCQRKLGPHPELAAIIATMEALNQGNPERSRFVFWFDN